MIGTIIGAVTGFLGGGAVSWFLWDKALKAKKTKLISEAETEGEVIKKEKILQAKEKYLQLKSEHERISNERNQKIIALENKLKQRETAANQQRNDLIRDIKNFESEKN